MCWTTTESFHKLYQKSKSAQEIFLSSIIKIESDPITLYPETIDHDLDGEQPLDIDKIKLGPNSCEIYKLLA